MAIAGAMLVILSGLVHSVWNLFAKKSVNKAVFLWLCQLTAILVFLPLAVWEWGRSGALSGLGWFWAGLSMGLHGVYVLLLAKTYEVGDLSQVYPIMRGMSPLLVPVIGVIVLREHLSQRGWLGVLLIVCGIALIGNMKLHQMRITSHAAVWTALAVGLMITCYTVTDKLALRYIPPFSLNELSNIGNLLALSWLALHSGAVRNEWRRNWRTILLGGILAPGGYVLFLMAMTFMPVSHLAPMREIGIVFGTVFGIVLLRERQGLPRIAAAVIITAGVVFLA